MISCALECFRLGLGGVGAGLLVGFSTYMRSAELVKVTVAEVAFPGDPVLIDPRHAAILIGRSKAGRPQWAKVRSALAVLALRVMVAGKPRDARVFDCTSRELLDGFKMAQIAIGFPVPIFVIHSLRHGGATHDFVSGALVFLDIRLQGRWSGESITLHYVQEGQAAILRATLPVQVVEHFRGAEWKLSALLWKLVAR
jgi:hypothetical protein